MHYTDYFPAAPEPSTCPGSGCGVQITQRIGHTPFLHIPEHTFTGDDQTILSDLKTKYQTFGVQFPILGITPSSTNQNCCIIERTAVNPDIATQLVHNTSYSLVFITMSDGTYHFWHRECLARQRWPEAAAPRFIPAKETLLFFMYNPVAVARAGIPASDRAPRPGRAPAAAAARAASPEPFAFSNPFFNMGNTPPSPGAEPSYAELPVTSGRSPSAATPATPRAYGGTAPQVRSPILDPDAGNYAPLPGENYAELPDARAAAQASDPLDCPYCQNKVNTDFFTDLTGKQLFTNDLNLEPLLTKALVADSRCFQALLAKKAEAKMLDPALTWRQEQLGEGIFIYSFGAGLANDYIGNTITQHMPSAGTPRKGASIPLNVNDILFTKIFMGDEYRWHTGCFVRYFHKSDSMRRALPDLEYAQYGKVVRIFET